MKSFKGNFLSFFANIVFRLFEFYFSKKVQDIRFARQLKSLFETADYIDNFLPQISTVKSPLEIHDYALSKITLSGYYLEFGVFSGKTINHIAKKIKYNIYGFDSFEGLPEFWREGFEKGTFNLEKKLPTVEPNVKLIKGWFDKTLQNFQIDQPIAYLHIDCDLYSSTKIIFEKLGPHIIPGTIIVFDEYFNYPGWQKGEYLAFKEFISDYKLNYEYLCYCRNHEQVAILIK